MHKLERNFHFAGILMILCHYMDTFLDTNTNTHILHTVVKASNKRFKFRKKKNTQIYKEVEQSTSRRLDGDLLEDK